MSSINKKLFNEIIGGQSEEWKPQNPIKDGLKIVLQKFGAIDVQSDDNKGSLYYVKFGGEVIRAIFVQADTCELNINEEVMGDGSKELVIYRENFSASTKRLVCWLNAKTIGD